MLLQLHEPHCLHQLQLATLKLLWGYWQAAGLDQPAGTLLALPLLDFPCGRYILSSNWQLPNGRNGDQHHLFPLESPIDPEARQGPMLPADQFKSTALDVDLSVIVGKCNQDRNSCIIMTLPSMGTAPSQRICLLTQRPDRSHAACRPLQEFWS